ncbi:phosphonopyruvate decarboxylase [Sphingomonas trueperi]|uniref:thiamine pyrophosphate-dependent enzyme n=1 Tax=Sphingomonas trueperi TaxID=53317 RepID=UPI00339B529D
MAHADEAGVTADAGLHSDRFLDGLSQRGYRDIAAVPCSYLAPLLSRAFERPDIGYLAATSEGEAVSVAAGAWLAGRRFLVIMQNSGLGDALNPLASLCIPYRVPVLLLISVRGEPGTQDEQHHDVMGGATTAILAAAGIDFAWLPADAADVDAVLDRAMRHVARSDSPFALLVRKGAFRAAIPPPSPIGGAFTRLEAIRWLRAQIAADRTIVTTTGLTGRELQLAGDRASHLYLSGAMGCASGVGLGLALSGKPAIVLDGDGAALMRLGTMVAIGSGRSLDLLHIVFNNGVYGSTGGQPVAAAPSFAAMARLFGYAATECDSLDGLAAAFGALEQIVGPRLIEVRVAPDSAPPAPRIALPLPDLALRTRAALRQR